MFDRFWMELTSLLKLEKDLVAVWPLISGIPFSNKVNLILRISTKPGLTNSVCWYFHNYFILLNIFVYKTFTVEQ